MCQLRRFHLKCLICYGQICYSVFSALLGKTNPSSSILQKKPLLKDVFSLLQEKSSKWDDIGRAFSVPFIDREKFRTDISLSNKACLERVLHVWLETSCHIPVTWLEFKNVLMSDSLGFKDTARQVQTFLEKEQLNITH